MNKVIKRKHHYVWAHYLKEWAENNNIYYISKKGNISNDSVLGLACEQDFYKVSFFNKIDLEIARYFANISTEELSKLHHNIINFVCSAQNIFDLARAKNIDNNIIKTQEDIFRSNLLENYLADIEMNSVSYLRALRDGNISILDGKSCRWDFCYYLGYQIARTKKYRESLNYSIGFVTGEQGDIDKLDDFFHKHWWFMCFYFGTNLASDLSLNKGYNFSLLTNFTDEPFITSDQPIVNINPLGYLSEAVDNYYPISETRALLIYSSNELSTMKDIYDKDTVSKLNTEIAKGAGKSIYSSSRIMIEKYKKSFNSREFKY
ncbi:hypothetical protein SOASR032_26220 [Pragia fontium]|uniref:DUF4238 domain-containing protein n=1 Tax=Pragia fontium TaxID=82985 RepID=A0ABQ5LKB1_9GAMM|nr:DUF4238 domain-containing protein [Pragia fontium]GKX64053.1 hypothetical protein SOASR032_26220 [Pragia fontium]